MFLQAFNYRIYSRISPPACMLTANFWSQKSVLT